MRVTLVHPAGFNFVPGQPDFSVLANRMAPIGILQLAAWLEQHGHPTAVHDCLGPVAPAGVAANVEHILATQPDLVGLSATTAGFMDAVDLAVELRRRRPEVRIIVGNVHASAIGAPLLRYFPEIDALCQGEGEGALLDVAEG
ncbi:MAG: cobalamin-dependent protein, partial [Verrucomicrobiota bacterium]